MVFLITRWIQDMKQGKNAVISAAQHFLDIQWYTEVLSCITKDPMSEKIWNKWKEISSRLYIFTSGRQGKPLPK